MKHFLTLLCLLAGCGVAVAADAPELAPAKNWVLPLFTRQNFRSMTLRGSEARARAGNEIDVIDLNLTAFTGDATNRVETILLSPAATFLPKADTAHGEKGVRIIRDDLEATGNRWTYDHTQKKISLHGNVRIAFKAELHDLLK